MKQDETKEKLIECTVELLLKSENPGKITARDITKASGVNLAMINYYFKSKEELLKRAVDLIIAQDFEKILHGDFSGLSDRQILHDILKQIIAVVYKYSSLSRLTIPYILLKDQITVPLKFYPYIRKCMKERNDSQCKIIAYQIISFLQLIFLREDEFFRFTGVNIGNVEERESFIKFQIYLFLGE